MAMIDWNSSLSVNVAELDRQHQKLIEIINALHEAMSQGKGKALISKILSDLVGYTETHFTAEEKYFDQFRYPGAAQQKKEHGDFVKKISGFRESFDKGSLILTMEVMNFLKDWLRNHIQKEDKKYSAFFNEKGLK